jgi:cytochrome b561
MSITEVSGVLGALAAVVGVFIALANMADEPRARLKSWALHAGRTLYGIYLVVAIAVSVAGITLFWLVPAPPSRGDILGLVLHLFNLRYIGAMAAEAIQSRKGRQLQSDQDRSRQALTPDASSAPP